MSVKELKWDTGLWLKDPKVTKCSIATQGAWFNLICAMHELDRTGEVTGTLLQLARIARCRETEIDNVIAEIENNSVGDVIRTSNGDVTLVTVVNRKMKRESDQRHGVRDRVAKMRASKAGLPTSDAAIFISTLFSRNLERAWEPNEIAKFRELVPVDMEELKVVSAFYKYERAKGDEGHQRRNLITFLNNFRGEVDKARTWAARNPVSAGTNGHSEPKGFREWLVNKYPDADKTMAWERVPGSIKAEFKEK